MQNRADLVIRERQPAIRRVLLIAEQELRRTVLKSPDEVLAFGVGQPRLAERPEHAQVEQGQVLEIVRNRYVAWLDVPVSKFLLMQKPRGLGELCDQRPNPVARNRRQYLREVLCRDALHRNE